MSRQLSIERVLAELQGRIENHRRKAAYHAEQEAFHQKEKVHHTAELQTITERFETFQAAVDAVSELVARPLSPIVLNSPPWDHLKIPPSSNLRRRCRDGHQGERGDAGRGA